MSEFLKRFAGYQLDQIRQGLSDYEEKFQIRSPTIANDLLEILPADVSYDATVKNVQRLKAGDNMKGATFLNACVELFSVKLGPEPGDLPPERELAGALRRYIGGLHSYAPLWKELEGDYLLRVSEQPVTPPPLAVAGQAGVPVGIPVKPVKPQNEQDASAVLSISAKDAIDYAPVSERYFFIEEDEDGDGEQKLSEANMLRRSGICLPLGPNDYLVMIRDFVFSHMYLLKREPDGFSGSMVLAGRLTPSAIVSPTGLTQPHHSVFMKQMVQG